MIQLDNVTFAYPHGPFRLHTPSLRVERGERIALVGPSGAGKTTLLSLIAGILRPDEGTIRAGGVELNRLSDAARRAWRISKIGLIFQELELLEYLTVRENVCLPYRINRAMRLTRDVRKAVDELAEAVGVGRLLGRYPHRLSQGERQRVAVCRALITRPELILADEPTGNLDPDNSRKIIQLILDRATVSNATVLVVTHDHSLLDRFDRVVNIRAFVQQDSPAEASP